MLLLIRYLKPALWEEIFITLLNVESCERLPDLKSLRESLEKYYQSSEDANLQAIHKLNNILGQKWLILQKWVFSLLISFALQYCKHVFYILIQSNILDIVPLMYYNCLNAFLINIVKWLEYTIGFLFQWAYLFLSYFLLHKHK